MVKKVELKEHLWLEALEIYNYNNAIKDSNLHYNKWNIPKKGTKEYDEVIEIMNVLKNMKNDYEEYLNDLENMELDFDEQCKYIDEVNKKINEKYYRDEKGEILIVNDKSYERSWLIPFKEKRNGKTRKIYIKNRPRYSTIDGDLLLI